MYREIPDIKFTISNSIAQQAFTLILSLIGDILYFEVRARKPGNPGPRNVLGVTTEADFFSGPL